MRRANLHVGREAGRDWIGATRRVRQLVQWWSTRDVTRSQRADLAASPAIGLVDDLAGLPEIAFEDRMATVEFRVGAHAHIVVDSDVCRSCTTKACVTACPANLFVPTADGGVLFNYEQCFECGTCYLVCNEEGALTWEYPLGGHGVVLHRS
jgi:ferredoxin like protein